MEHAQRPRSRVCILVRAALTRSCAPARHGCGGGDRAASLTHFKVREEATVNLASLPNAMSWVHGADGKLCFAAAPTEATA
eukprot:5631780-Prymnesium_polylepis.1